jgi:hypothetical protein
MNILNLENKEKMKCITYDRPAFKLNFKNDSNSNR